MTTVALQVIYAPACQTIARRRPPVDGTREGQRGIFTLPNADNNRTHFR